MGCVWESGNVAIRRPFRREISRGGNDANFFATKEEEGRATERTKEEQSSIWRSHGAGGIRKKAKQPIKINKPTPEE